MSQLRKSSRTPSQFSLSVQSATSQAVTPPFELGLPSIFCAKNVDVLPELNPLSNLTTTFVVRIPRGCAVMSRLGRPRPDPLSPIGARERSSDERLGCGRVAIAARRQMQGTEIVCGIDPEPVGATRMPERKQRQAGGSRCESCSATWRGDAVNPTTSRAAPAAAARRRSSGASRSRAPAAGPERCFPGSAPQRVCRLGQDPNQSQTCR